MVHMFKYLSGKRSPFGSNVKKIVGAEAGAGVGAETGAGAGAGAGKKETLPYASTRRQCNDKAAKLSSPIHSAPLNSRA